MKTVDIRLVLTDDTGVERLVISLTKDPAILGAAVLENDGFGRSLPTGWRDVPSTETKEQIHDLLNDPNRKA